MANLLQDEVRVQIYRYFLTTGRAPSAMEIAALLNRHAAEIEWAYARLAEARVITFVPGTQSIWMAHPFSAEPTPYRVRSGRKTYWANCAWDVLGIAAMLGRDAECTCRCPDCDQSLEISVKHGRVREGGVIHFVVPPRRFWDNIAFT